MATKYLLNGASGVDSDLAPATDINEKALITQTHTDDCAVDPVPKAQTALVFAWSTEPNVPNDPDWDNGYYNASVDITLMETGNGIDRVYATLVRVDSGGTVQETLATSPDWTTTGVKTFGATVDPSAGAATDRYQIRVYVQHTGHTSAAVTIRVSASDSWIEGEFIVGGIIPLIMHHRSKTIEVS